MAERLPTPFLQHHPMNLQLAFSRFAADGRSMYLTDTTDYSGSNRNLWALVLNVIRYQLTDEEAVEIITQNPLAAIEPQIAIEQDGLYRVEAGLFPLLVNLSDSEGNNALGEVYYHNGQVVRITAAVETSAGSGVYVYDYEAVTDWIGLAESEFTLYKEVTATAKAALLETTRKWAVQPDEQRQDQLLDLSVRIGAQLDAICYNLQLGSPTAVAESFAYLETMVENANSLLV